MACTAVENELSALNDTYQTLLGYYDQCGCVNGTVPSEDPCAGEAGAYSQGMHIGGIFIILAVSLLGTLLPILGQRVPALKVHPFLLALGKAASMGVVITVSLVHMLLPANESLTSECLPHSFVESYEAWAYMFCVAAALLMHAIDVLMERIIRSRYALVVHDAAPADGAVVVAAGDKKKAAGGGEDVAQPLRDAAVGGSGGSADEEAAAAAAGGAADPHHPTTEPAAAAVHDVRHGDHVHRSGPATAGHGAAAGEMMHHHHCHALPNGAESSPVQRVIAAALMEFGVTVHSIFIGIAVGVVPDSELRPLLVALSFHQFFEGIALGSRLADAAFREVFEAVLALVFSVAAPVGMAIGIGLVADSTFNENSVNYLLTQGIFDAVCAGILLYLGFGLMFADFAIELQKHSDRSRLAMFASAWIGAFVMAFIGRYL